MDEGYVGVEIYIFGRPYRHLTLLVSFRSFKAEAEMQVILTLYSPQAHLTFEKRVHH